MMPLLSLSMRPIQISQRKSSDGDDDDDKQGKGGRKSEDNRGPGNARRRETEEVEGEDDEDEDEDDDDDEHGKQMVMPPLAQLPPQLLGFQVGGLPPVVGQQPIGFIQVPMGAVIPPIASQQPIAVPTPITPQPPVLVDSATGTFFDPITGTTIMSQVPPQFNPFLRLASF